MPPRIPSSEPHCGASDGAPADTEPNMAPASLGTSSGQSSNSGPFGGITGPVLEPHPGQDPAPGTGAQEAPKAPSPESSGSNHPRLSYRTLW